jgi:hypothetical protein
MTTEAHIFVAVLALLALGFVLRLLRRGRLSGKYALLWTVTGVALLVLAIWPGLLTTVSDWVGVFSPPNLLMVVALGFLLLVVVQFSWELSRLEERTRTLAEELALLKTETETEAGPPPSER